MKKTKIICTIGPSSQSKEVLKQLMLSGMNGARLNFSHGSYDEQREKILLIKELREELCLPIPIILDTKGPEIRTGDFKGGEVELKAGQPFILMTDDAVGDEGKCSVTYKNICSHVKPGSHILLDDGLIQLTVTEIKKDAVITTVDNGGTLKDKRGVNVPNAHFDIPALTEKDKQDIKFGIRSEVDFIAASFIRSKEDVEYIRQFLHDNAGDDIAIIAKIENKEGIDHIDDIIHVSDGIMVARGDMGVEIPAEEVPLVQKSIIEKCNRAGKLVITATQMLDSMIRNPRPTRAEVADVANAVLDGTDCIMLSGETAVGDYPVESVETMVKAAVAAESGIDYEAKLEKHRLYMDCTVTNAIGYSACSSAESVKATAILAATSSGYTARTISGYRPKCPIIAFSTMRSVVRKLALAWGVMPYYHRHMEAADVFFGRVIDETRNEGHIKDGDVIVLTAGLPFGIGGTTNMMWIRVVKE